MIFVSVLLYLVILAVYYGPCVFAFGLCGGFEAIRRAGARTLMACGLLLLGAFAVAAVWIAQNRFVYFWDYSDYWMKSVDFGNQIAREPLGALPRLCESVNADDHNMLVGALLSLPLHVLGNGYPAYVLLAFALFVLPAFAVQSVLLQRLATSEDGTRRPPLWLCTLLAVLFPMAYYATLKGYADGSVYLLCSLLILLLLDRDMGELELWRSLVTGILLLWALLSRRYTAYFIEAYAFVLIAFAIRALVVHRRAGAVGAVFANFGLMAIPPTLCMVVGFRQLLRTVLTTDYAGQFVGYSGDFPSQVHHVAQYYGFIAIALCALGLVTAYVLRRRRFFLTAMACMVVFECLSLFTVQNVDVHHAYILSSQVLALETFFPLALWGWAERRGLRVAETVVVAVLGVSFAAVYAPPVTAATAATGELLPTRYAPFVRNDLDSLHELAGYLNGLADEGGQIYVLSSSLTLNSEILRLLDYPAVHESVRNLYVTHDVDLRDGFPTTFVEADVLVVADPPQTHLAEGTQEVVRYLAEQVMDPASPIGRHYEETRSFPLDGGVTARVYLKTSPLEAGDIEALRDHFAGLYPDAGELFADRLTPELAANQPILAP